MSDNLNNNNNNYNNNNNNNINLSKNGAVVVDEEDNNDNKETTTSPNPILKNTEFSDKEGANLENDDLENLTEYCSLRKKSMRDMLSSITPHLTSSSPSYNSNSSGSSNNSFSNSSLSSVVNDKNKGFIEIDMDNNISNSNGEIKNNPTKKNQTISNYKSENKNEIHKKSKSSSDHHIKNSKRKKARELTPNSSPVTLDENNLDKKNTIFENSDQNKIIDSIDTNDISNNTKTTTTTTTAALNTLDSMDNSNTSNISNSKNISNISNDSNNNNNNDSDNGIKDISGSLSNPNGSSPSGLKVEYRDDITPIEEDYDRKQFYEYRDSHRENGEHGAPSINPETDLNKKYDEFSERKRLKETSKWGYFKFLFNKNKYKWDINQNQRFYLAAQIITRFGFLSKTILYCSLGVLSLAAAVDKERTVAGPDGVFEELQEMFSGGVIILLLLGLWSYGCWGIFYIVFDVDQLGHKSAGAILKRFGRVFSSGFYFVLGVDAARVLAHTRKEVSGTSHILGFLYKYIFGQIIVCVLGVTFFVVSLVYLIYFIKPDKFKRELSTERMNKYLYWSALGFARIGAVGRSMFFGAFGGVLIKAVADIHKGVEPDTGLLGFQGVFQQIANYNTPLLFIIAILIMFYALWCFWLMFFRRLPAHQDAIYARQVLGTHINKKYVFNRMLFNIKRNVDDPDDDDDDNSDHDMNSIDHPSSIPKDSSDHPNDIYDYQATTSSNNNNNNNNNNKQTV
ncbi:hypothetical protein RB653_010143 [Dictyostelium firmibasis]|uniref:DUF1206 domain-containing protein n=1 Tax=Dictyostelium firmibasis TaxID=79012 RepID=A0AAN7TL44_9MYCE